jgi:hypothetical protein
MSEQHERNYERYTHEHSRLRIEHYEAQQAAIRRDRMEIAQDVASKALHATGVAEWIRKPDDETEVKAALFDMMLGNDDGEMALEATQRHIRSEQRLLLFKAAASVLPDNAGGAWTVGRMCARCI